MCVDGTSHWLATADESSEWYAEGERLARAAARSGEFALAARLCARLLEATASSSACWLHAFAASASQPGAGEAAATGAFPVAAFDLGLEHLAGGDLDEARALLGSVALDVLGPERAAGLEPLWPCFTPPHPGAATAVENVRNWRILHRQGYFPKHPRYQDRYQEAGLAKILELLSPTATDEVLELGCGYGRLLYHLLPRVRRAIGVDPGTPLEETREFVAGRGDCTLLRTDGLTLWPTPDACVDAAYALTVFQHLTRAGVSLYMHELRRVLRPGGRVCAQFLSGGNPSGEMLVEVREQSLSYTAGQVVAVAEQAGFVVQALIREPTRHAGFDWLWLLGTKAA
jgi:SAM-dependent methyltransferase